MAISPATDSQPPAGGKERKPEECPPDNKLPENSQDNLDAKLDHALEETFPTSDPVSVNITKGGGIDSDPAAERRQGDDDQGKDAGLISRIKGVVSDMAASASGPAREAYQTSERYMHDARQRYPYVERSYQEGRQVVSQRVIDNPLVALLVAGAVGYALAWLIHGKSRVGADRVPDYARTTPRFGARDRE